MTPEERYRADLQREDFHFDEAQRRAVAAIERLYRELLTDPPPAPSLPFWKKLFAADAQPAAVPKGLYLWGGVGRGKTYLIDSFFECLPFAEKQRVHFQRFMESVHVALRNLPKHRDPLPVVAAQMAHGVRVLCLDEFHVDDVADAMLLAGLLSALIAQGVVLVFTSNIQPDYLYKTGLQRERFIPAIELIKQYTEVVYLDGQTDYRLGQLERSETFLSSADPDTHKVLRAHFERMVGSDATYGAVLHINHRDVPTVAEGEDVVWFDFSVLCATARSSSDYLEICQRYNTVILSDITVMSEASEDVANRFIQLIDALYDHKLQLIASARDPIEKLYSGRALKFEFQRTESRLREMFSLPYAASRKRLSAARPTSSA